MTAATLSQNQTLDAQTLLALDFSAEEIAKLERMKESYSVFSEHFESNREFHNLSFLKWQYENGKIERG